MWSSSVVASRSTVSPAVSGYGHPSSFGQRNEGMGPLSRLAALTSTGRMGFEPLVQEVGLAVHAGAKPGEDEPLRPAPEQRDVDLELAVDHPFGDGAGL